MITTDSPYRLPIADRAQVWRAIGRLVAQDRWVFTVVVTLYVAAACTGAAIPILLGSVVDGVTSGWHSSRADVLGLLVLLCIAAQFVLIRYGRREGYRFGERAAAELRESSVDKVLDLPLNLVEQAGVGDLATRCGSDMNSIAELLRKTGPNVVIAAIEITVILTAAFTVHPSLGLLCTVSIPILCWGTWRYVKRSEAVFLSERVAMSAIAETLTASLSGARTVASYGMEEQRRMEGRLKIEDHYQRLFGILQLQTRFFPAIDMAFLMPVVLTVTVGSFWYINGGNITAGEIVAVSLLGIRLESPLKGIMLAVNGFQEGAAALSRIEGIRNQVVEPRSASTEGSNVSFDDVYFGYTASKDVLQGLTLHIPPGERLAVVGPSGAGKSTIARLIAGIDRTRKGAVLLGGVPAADVAKEELRRRVVLVTQEHHIFSTTLRENLTLAASNADDECLFRALDTVGANWVGELEDGLDTELGKRHLDLGVSEAQQVALARVVLADPEIVILDEATVGIDVEGNGVLEDSLSAAFAGRTVISIVHQLQAAETADRIVVVDKGAIVESGSHRELQHSGGVYSELWNSWKGSV